jgi:cytochrome c oxidase cbb3-type subunit I/II
MYVAGITQGLMWRAENEGGGLMYPQFVETYLAIRPLYWGRLVGGSVYLLGFFLMAWNLWMTAKSGKAIEGEVEVPKRAPKQEEERSWKQLVFSPPIVVAVLVMAVLSLVAISDEVASIIFIVIAAALIFGFFLIWSISKRSDEPGWHHILEGRALIFTVLTVIAILIGGIAELIPTIVATPEQVTSTAQEPYTPLELEGRDVYIQEGCYTCHSQMIRPFTWETARYGAISDAENSVYDHPFQWGSRRIGPDLARVGGKYSHTWHYNHMIDPRQVTPGSNMPVYAPLATAGVSFEDTAVKLRAMRTVGVPYDAETIQTSEDIAWSHARAIASELEADAGITTCEGEAAEGCDLRVDGQLTALIAYLQRLGVTAAPSFEGEGGDLLSDASDAPETSDTPDTSAGENR